MIFYYVGVLCFFFCLLCVEFDLTDSKLVRNLSLTLVNIYPFLVTVVNCGILCDPLSLPLPLRPIRPSLNSLGCAAKPREGVRAIETFSNCETW